MTMEPEREVVLPVSEPGGEEPPRSEAVKPFTEHLEDLRFVLIKSLIVLVLACGACLYFTRDIMKIFEWPLNRLALTDTVKVRDMSQSLLRSLHPADAFMVSLKVVLVAGLIVASPFIIYFLWQFVSPGLTARERRMVLPIFGAGVVFFLLGVAFCYLVVLYACLRFFYTYTIQMGIQPDWTIDNYVSFVATMLIAFGVVFEMPVVAALLAKFRLVGSGFLSGKRLVAWFIISIVAAIVTPPDVLSMILLLVPMMGLYEISILITKVIEKGDRTA
jgi:sec-independent protein translocase protein TatC